MRKGEVYRNGEHLGTLTEKARGQYHFIYTPAWVSDPTKSAVSLRLPKREEAYESEVLFPFFFNMLSEGVNRKLQSRQLRIDEDDHFGLLLATAGYDTIGAITIREAEEES